MSSLRSVAALAALGLSSIGTATTITVTSLSAGSNDATGCTLRDAIQAVNTRAAVGQCPAASGPVDTINFRLNTFAGIPEIDFSQRDPNSFNAALPALMPGRSLNIYGKESQYQYAIRLSRTAGGNCGQGTHDPSDFRFLEVLSGAALNISDFFFQYGCADAPVDAANDITSPNANGGAIANYGTLYVVNSDFIGNNANGWGGAIYNGVDAQLGVSSTTFNNNTASVGGGAVFVDTHNGNNYAQFDASLFEQNRVLAFGVIVHGGAIRSRGTLVVNNSTFFKDQATNLFGDDGHEIYSAGTLALSFSTFLSDGASTSHLTIAANSTAFIKSSLFDGGGNCAGGSGASVTWSGISISSDPTCAGGSNLTNTSPGFASTLANNGGPTQTLQLLTGSPAFGVDADCMDTSATPVTTDQRGFSRPLIRCDAGAYEDTIFANGFN